jgi:phosphoribosyl 1,2-cyclic phosphodiesterase
MSMYYTSLNSGSNGNCYYIGNEEEAVLVDVGISCREVEKRLSRLSLDLKKIKAIFISHEHSDHIRGVQVLSRKHRIPVYITPGTHKSGALFLEAELTYSFQAYQKIMVGKLSVTAFPKFHDADDPHSFIVEGHDITIGVFTDIGVVCEHVVANFKLCHAVFLETNYDEGMLENGMYPIYLKQRIKSDKGHLSNDQALELFAKHRPEFMKHVFLSHLSKENNSPELVKELFLKNAGIAKIEVASRSEEMELSCIRLEKTSEGGERIPVTETIKQQISLF